LSENRKTKDSRMNGSMHPLI